MGLTKRQKIEVLKLAIKHLEERKTHFMCVAIRYAYNEITDKVCEYPLEMIPELLNYKPYGASDTGGWFGYHDFPQRIKILNLTISDLEEKEKNSLIKRIRDKIINILSKI